MRAIDEPYYTEMDVASSGLKCTTTVYIQTCKEQRIGLLFNLRCQSSHYSLPLTLPGWHIDRLLLPAL